MTDGLLILYMVVVPTFFIFMKILAMWQLVRLLEFLNEFLRQRYIRRDQYVNYAARMPRLWWPNK